MRPNLHQRFICPRFPFGNFVRYSVSFIIASLNFAACASSALRAAQISSASSRIQMRLLHQPIPDVRLRPDIPSSARRDQHEPASTVLRNFFINLRNPYNPLRCLVARPKPRPHPPILLLRRINLRLQLLRPSASAASATQLLLQVLRIRKLRLRRVRATVMYHTTPHQSQAQR